MSVVQTIDVYTQSEGTELLLVSKTLSDSLNPSNNWSAGAPNSNAAKTDITTVVINITASTWTGTVELTETSDWFIRTNSTKAITLTDLDMSGDTITDGLYYIRTYPFISLGVNATATAASTTVTLASGTNEALLAAGYTHLLLGATIHEIDIEATTEAATNLIILVDAYDGTTGSYAASAGYYNLTEYCNSYNTEADAAEKLAVVDLCNCSNKCFDPLMKLWDTWQVMNIQKQIKSHTEAEETRKILYKQVLSTSCNDC